MQAQESSQQYHENRCGWCDPRDTAGTQSWISLRMHMSHMPQELCAHQEAPIVHVWNPPEPFSGKMGMEFMGKLKAPRMVTLYIGMT